MATATSARTTDFDAVVVGAGFAGLYMLHRLRNLLGLSARVYEIGDGVGGTWYWNRYPGARCDVDCYVYCYSFDKDLLQEWEWSGKFPEQPEILRYLNHVADRFDLRKDIQLNTRVTAARFLEADNCWEIKTDRGERVTAQFLITAIGCLSVGQIPSIKGLDSFEGKWHHTGAWPHEGVDLAGKRVGVIGTGSSGVQSIPVIAAQAEHLYVFQRTAQFASPARHETVNAKFLQDIKARYDEVWKVAHSSFYGYYPQLEPLPRSALEADDEERRASYEAMWAKGGVTFGAESFSDIFVDRRANDTLSEFMRSKIREIVKNPDTAEMLVPTDHPYGSKRPLLDTDYFDTYNRDNVTLVDIRHSPIQEITPKGIRTEDGEYALDVIVFATGFDAITGPFNRIDIRGRGGLSLKEKWVQGPKAYLGLASAGFPNLFMITGPGSPSVLTNVPVSIEHHVEWIAAAIEHMRERDMPLIEPEAAAEAEWVAHVSELAEQTIYMLADSWYVGANIPGKPRVFSAYVAGHGPYRVRCDEIVARGYSGFVLRGQATAAA